MKPIAVLHHENCPDGFGAAWAARKKFWSQAEYYAIPATQDAHQLEGVPLKNREVYFLDVCVSLPALLKLRLANRKVVVIDHHATSAATAAHATEHRFDVTHSGAVLAWEHFHPRKKIPLLLQYLEDGDLWRWKLPQAKTLLAYVYSRPFDYKEYDVLARGMESARERKRYLMLGKTLAEYARMLVDEAARRAELVQFGKHRVLAVNSSSKHSHSEVGHALAARRPPLGIVWRVERGEIHVSLRGDGSVDVAKLAKQFPGGGGHPNAAGFTTSFSKGLPWKVLESR